MAQITISMDPVMKLALMDHCLQMNSIVLTAENLIQSFTKLARSVADLSAMSASGGTQSDVNTAGHRGQRKEHH